MSLNGNFQNRHYHASLQGFLRLNSLRIFNSIPTSKLAQRPMQDCPTLTREQIVLTCITTVISFDTNRYSNESLALNSQYSIVAQTGCQFNAPFKKDSSINAPSIQCLSQLISLYLMSKLQDFQQCDQAHV